MMNFKNLTLIGTSHISPESIEEVKHAIATKKPQIIALELDIRRFQSLLGPKQKISFRGIRQLGIKAWVLNIVGSWVEEKLGKMVGVAPGTEMKTAITLAAQTKAKIALIDRDITITLKRLTSQITFREKIRFVLDILKGLLGLKPKMQFDLKKVPSSKMIKQLLEEVKKSYPNVHRVLVQERDEHMAKALYKLMNTETDKEIVAVVGAGHEESIIQKIQRARQSASSQNKK